MIQPRPNILFILSDNIGYGELGCYGGGVLRGAPTTRIDTLASEGIRLTNCNVESQCTPSRSALMTGRFAIRSGTHTVPFGGAPEGLVQWELTIAELLSAHGYATGHWGKWHLGSTQGRFPTDQGFDEWWGCPRTMDETIWFWSADYDPAVVRPQPIYEGRRGEPSREVAVFNPEARAEMDSRVAEHAVGFMRRCVEEETPFYCYVPFTIIHWPDTPHPDFIGTTRNGSWARLSS